MARKRQRVTVSKPAETPRKRKRTRTTSPVASACKECSWAIKARDPNEHPDSYVFDALTRATSPQEAKTRFLGRCPRYTSILSVQRASPQPLL